MARIIINLLIIIFLTTPILHYLRLLPKFISFLDVNEEVTSILNVKFQTASVLNEKERSEIQMHDSSLLQLLWQKKSFKCRIFRTSTPDEFHYHGLTCTYKIIH